MLESSEVKRSNSLYDAVLVNKRGRATSAPQILEQLELYLSEPLLPMENVVEDRGKNKIVRTSPLHFWKTNRERFPTLSPVARDIFNIPASPGSIERSFSIATDILTAKRNRTLPDAFAHSMFVKCNKKRVTDTK